eukprot:353281-Chlamydomonas_euryale.AAC.3
MLQGRQLSVAGGMPGRRIETLARQVSQGASQRGTPLGSLTNQSTVAHQAAQSGAACGSRESIGML